MKILLVRPDQGSDFQITPPLGLGYIAASLKRQGHEVVLLDAALEHLGSIEAVEYTACHSPDAIFIQVYTGSEEWAKRYILGYKIYVPRPRIIVGGHHIAATGDILGADYGFEGEGECVTFDGVRIPYSTSPGTLIDPNDIPQPDWELLQPQRYWPYMQSANIPLKGKRPIPIVSSRGCPYKCTFCASHIVAGRKFRPREVSNIIEEIKYLQWRYDCDEIWFSDDNLTFDYNRAISLFKAMIPLGIHWRAPNGIRVDRLTTDMPKLMKESGCYMAGLGVESGSTEMLTKIKKGIQLYDVSDAVMAFRGVGIMTSGFFIVGLPGETPRHFQYTVDFALGVPFDRIQVSPFQVYPGSEIQAKKDRLPVMPPDMVTRLQKRLFLKFYLRPRIIWSLLIRLRWSQIKAIFKHPWVKGWMGR